MVAISGGMVWFWDDLQFSSVSPTEDGAVVNNKLLEEEKATLQVILEISNNFYSWVTYQEKRNLLLSSILGNCSQELRSTKQVIAFSFSLGDSYQNAYEQLLLLLFLIGNVKFY